MKSILRVAAVVVAASALGACGGGKAKGARSADSEKASKDGCPDEDPFCKDKGGKAAEETTGSSESASSSSESSTSSSGSEASGSAASRGKSAESATDEVVVIKTAKPPAEAKDKDGKGKDEKAKKPAAKGKPEKPKTATVVLWPKGLSYGMGAEQIAKLYDRLFDSQYVELYKKTPVGPQTEQLDNELQEKKRLLRQNKLAFGNLPTGMDNTVLKNEFSYQNNESMTKLDLGNGLVRNFFFFGDRLWKVYDEHTLGKSPIGANWGAAVQYMTGKLGTEPKLIEPGPGRDYQEAEWTDGTTIVRMVNRDFQQLVGVIFVESSVESQLPTLRKNRKQDLTAVEQSVANATRAKAPPETDKKKDAKKGDAKKKK
jgi:hypothetical protein